MQRRGARQSLALALREVLGDDERLRVARTLVRGRDAVVWLADGRNDGRAAVAVRLVPRNTGGEGPAERLWTRRFLLLPATGSPARSNAERALLVAARERLSAGEDALPEGLVERALRGGPVLAVGLPSACEQACVFCRDHGSRRRREQHPGGRRAETAARAARTALGTGRPRHARVLFQGEDALAAPHLVDLVREADRLGYEEIAVLTPGARLGDGALAADLVAAGLDTIETALYGATAVDHDATTRTPGAFERLTTGLARVVEAGVHVIVHTALAREVLPRLADIAAFAAARGLSFERAEAIAPDRGQEARYAAVAPSLGEIRAAFAAAAPALPRPFSLVDLPDCALAPGLVPHGGADDLAVVQRGPGSSRWPTRHVAACSGCARRSVCPGPSLALTATHGSADLRPFPGGAAAPPAERRVPVDLRE